jgi:hypothetical protein
MHNHKARREVSEELATALDGLLRREQGVELVRRGELRRIIEGFDVTGIPALLFKGAALAYTHYPFPHLRPRCDTDLLVRPGDRLRASGLLASLGYHRLNVVDLDAVLTQWMFEKPGIGGVVHTLDLHWHISNRPLFRDILSFDELEPRADAIPAIGRGANTPCAVHSLVLACVHPVAHHHCDWRLIWLYDILLLAQDLDPGEWAQFLDLAARKKVSDLCRHAFQLVSQHFGPARWLRERGILEISERLRAEEPSRAYLSEERNRRRDLIFDVNAISGVWNKLRFVAAHTFPDVHYVRTAYGVSGGLSVAAAYGRRIFNAGLQLIRAGRPQTDPERPVSSDSQR